MENLIQVQNISYCKDLLKTDIRNITNNTRGTSSLEMKSRSIVTLKMAPVMSNYNVLFLAIRPELFNEQITLFYFSR